MSLKSCQAYAKETCLIIIATAAGVFSIGLGQAIFSDCKNKILEKVNAIGKNCIFVFASNNKGGAKPITLKEFSEIDASLTKQFGKKIKVTPILFYRYTTSSLKKPFDKFSSLISCIEKECFEITKRKLKSGRHFNKSDNFKKVCIVGNSVPKNFGETISFDGLSFLIIGVLEKAPQVSQQDPNEDIFIPFDIGNVLLNDSKVVHEIIISVDQETMFQSVIDTVNQCLKNIRRVKKESEKDWTIFDQKSFRNTSLATTKLLKNLVIFFSIITMCLCFLACINSILFNIKSRSQEIQIMLKIGAPETIIFKQFLYESIFKFSIGLACGVGACAIAAVGLKINLFTKTHALWLISFYLILTILTSMAMAWRAIKQAL